MIDGGPKFFVFLLMWVRRLSAVFGLTVSTKVLRCLNYAWSRVAELSVREYFDIVVLGDDHPFKLEDEVTVGLQ